jgi:glycosyltransferase involved in cell wall biosynthesis
VSPNVEAQLKKCGMPAGRLSLIENGIDAEQFSCGRPVLRELPAFDGKLVVGFVGRLAPEKGLAILLHAAQEILRNRTDVLFVLVGEGPERIELQSLVTQLGLESSVLFLGQRSDLADVYASFDIFVLPSYFEAMPMVVLEAMAAGKPVIATRVGGVPGMINDQESGILTEPGDVKGFASALGQLLQQPEKARQFGQRGLELIQTRFSANVMARAYLDIYQKVLAAEADRNSATPMTTAHQ